MRARSGILSKDGATKQSNNLILWNRGSVIGERCTSSFSERMVRSSWLHAALVAAAASSLLPLPTLAERIVDLPTDNGGRETFGLGATPPSSSRRRRGLQTSSMLTTGFEGTIPSPSVEFDVVSTSEGTIALTGLAVHVLAVGPDGTSF